MEKAITLTVQAEHVDRIAIALGWAAGLEVEPLDFIKNNLAARLKEITKNFEVREAQENAAKSVQEVIIN